MEEKRPYIAKAKSTEWETPPELFDALWEEFGGFDLDPCCTPEQYTAQRIMDNGGGICVPSKYTFCPDDIEMGIMAVSSWDGLDSPWYGKVYMNPPYGREEGKWVAKAYEEVHKGNAELVAALLPVRTDTVRWHTYIHGKAEIRFLKGRLRFVGAPASAPFPSAIVIWRR